MSFVVVDVYDSSDSFWLPVEILDVTTDFVDRQLCTYRVIPPKRCGSGYGTMLVSFKCGPITLSMSTAEFGFQLYHPAKFYDANLAF